MPSGAKKRRAAKKKKKARASKNSVSSPAARARHGESSGGELSSPASKAQRNSPHPAVKAERREGNSSGNKSLTMERTEKAAKEKKGNIEIDTGSNLQKPHEKNLSSRSSGSDDKSRIDKKKAVVIEPAPVVELVQPIQSLPEKGAPKGEVLAVKTSPIVNSVNVVEAASQVNNNTKIQEKNDFVATETPSEQTVIVNENASKYNCPTSTTSVVVEPVPKENGVEKLLSSDEKASAKSKDIVAASTYGKCPFCGRNGSDRVNEPKTPECSERQPLVASAPRAVEKTSWKSCCGIFG